MGDLRNKIAKLERVERDKAAMAAMLRQFSTPAAPEDDGEPGVHALNEKIPLKWIWVCCCSPFCNHARALPLAPWRIRWGVENPIPLMQLHFRCGVCDRPGCVFSEPRPNYSGANGTVNWDPEMFPAGDIVRMAGQRIAGESFVQRDERVSAAYLARYPSGDAITAVDAMCNLYSVTTSQDAIRQLARYTRDMAGNMPPIPAVFPNRMAPIVRTGADGVRELLMARWGFPPPSIPGSKPRNPYLTNVRKTDSRYWRPWLSKPEQRCLVPVTSFAEPDNNQGPKSIWTWFARDDDRPVFFFAGIWREWEGDRGTKAIPDVGRHLVFSFLTTDASHDVSPVHSDATPVCLFTEDEREMWMNAPVEIALGLQRPPDPGSLKIVATGQKQDGVSP